MSTKQEWKETGRDLGHAFKGFGTTLGKTIVKSVKTGVNAATDWAADDGSQNKEDDVVVDVPPTEDN